MEISTILLSGTDFLRGQHKFSRKRGFIHRKSVPESSFVEIIISDYFFGIKKLQTEIFETINKFDTQMISSGWKMENRKDQNIYWLHLAVKEELGNKQYNSLKAEGKLKMLEKELTKGETIYQLLSSL